MTKVNSKKIGSIVVVLAICMMAAILLLEFLPAKAANSGKELTTTMQPEVASTIPVQQTHNQEATLTRKQVLNILLESHPQGSRWISLDEEDLKSICNWLSKEKPDEIIDFRYFYNLENGYDMCLTNERTIELYNPDGWVIESFNVDAIWEWPENFVAASGATYYMIDGNLIESKLGSTRLVPTDFSPAYIWASENKEVLYVQNGNKLGFVYNGEFKLITEHYGYGVTLSYQDDENAYFDYFNDAGKAETTGVQIRMAEDFGSSLVISLPEDTDL